MCGIFQELQIVHETGYFSALPSLEEYWQQVNRNGRVPGAPVRRGGSACTLGQDGVWLEVHLFFFFFFFFYGLDKKKFFLIKIVLKRTSAASGAEGTLKRAFFQRSAELSLERGAAALLRSECFCPFLGLLNRRADPAPRPDPGPSPWQKFGACTSSRLHSWNLSYEFAWMPRVFFFFKGFVFVFLFGVST